MLDAMVAEPLSVTLQNLMPLLPLQKSMSASTTASDVLWWPQTLRKERKEGVLLQRTVHLGQVEQNMHDFIFKKIPLLHIGRTQISYLAVLESRILKLVSRVFSSLLPFGSSERKIHFLVFFSF
jgi:hypothetical protein